MWAMILEWLVSLFTSGNRTVKNIEIIKESEGLRLEAYLPTPNDKWTIGYGHTKGVARGQRITKDQAETYLREDLDWVEACINKLVKVPLSQNQFDAVASLVFNIGQGNFERSSVLRNLNLSKYKEAADSFLMWNKQTNKTTGKLEVLKGLDIRRKKERELFLK